MNTQLLIIVVAAMVAGVVLFRLYMVLGRRTGDEHEQPQERFRGLSGPVEPVAAIPGPRADAPSKPVDDLARAMMDIKLADRTFETDHFITGAKKAHEMIVTAFAKGDRDTLRPLVSDEVFQAFDHAIAERQRRKESVKYTLVGYRDVRIVHAAMEGRSAEITLNLAVQFISSTSDETGTLIEGDPAAVRDVTDIWTFSRDLRSSDPNWTLVATAGGEV